MSTAPDPDAAGAPAALVLFAHGARDPRWAAPFEAVAARIRALQPGRTVRLAFLELMAPSLPALGAELAAGGCREITVVPMFLGTGGHLRRDLPQLLQTLRDAHPHLRIALAPAIGEHPDVAEAMARAAVAVAAAAAAGPAGIAP